MKIVIKQKRYDTGTAFRCASWNNGRSASDPDWFSESLYRKQTGEYFLHGEGNANSKYAKSTGDNTWAGTEKIIPLSYESAKKWAEAHLDSAKYKEIFGAVGEDNSRCVVTFSLPGSAVEKLKKMSSKYNRKQSDILTQLITQAKL